VTFLYPLLSPFCFVVVLGVGGLEHRIRARIGPTIHIGRTDSMFKATKPRSCLVRTSKSVVIWRHMTMTTLLDIDGAKRFFSRITRGTNTTINGRAASM
jgi:hypothetical protein